MLTTTLSALFRRDLAALRREVEAYPTETSLWITTQEVPNSGGVLTRHLCGNLQHFLGAVLGGTGYRRDRTHEFQGPPTPRATLLAGIAATERAVLDTLAHLSATQLNARYPETMGGNSFQTGDLLVHLATHCAFHLGQIDYHRRLVAGSGGSIAPMGLAALASARAVEAG